MLWGRANLGNHQYNTLAAEAESSFLALTLRLSSIERVRVHRKVQLVHCHKSRNLPQLF